MVIPLKLDVSVLRALSSQTRLRILKRLSSRRMTQSELSKYLGMHVSTIKDHLEILENTGLVEMADEGYKWKYYDLTKSGKFIAYPSKKEIEILFPVGIFLMIIGMSSHIIRFVTSFFPGSGIYSGAAPKAGVLMESAASDAVAVSQPITAPTSYISSLSLLQEVSLILGVIIVLYLIVRISLSAGK